MWQSNLVPRRCVSRPQESRPAAGSAISPPLQGIRPLGNHKRFLDDQRGRHVATDLLPARIVGGKSRQRTGRTESLVLIVLPDSPAASTSAPSGLACGRNNASRITTTSCGSPLSNRPYRYSTCPESTGNRARLACSCLRRRFLFGLGVGFLQERIDPAAIRSHVLDNAGTSAVVASSRRSRSRRPSTGHKPSQPTKPIRARIRPRPPIPAPHDNGPPSASSSAAAASSSSSASTSGCCTIATSDGSCRFSGRAFHTAARSASSSSARPRLVSFCLRVSQSRKRVNQIVVGQLVVFLRPVDGRASAAVPLPSLSPSGSVGVMRRISLSRMRSRSSKSLGRVRHSPTPPAIPLRPHVALDVGAGFGQQGFAGPPWPLSGDSGVRAERCAALNVSSRKVTPTPSVPPTSLSVAGVHALPFIISANRANRTQMTLPSWANPATACSRNFLCSRPAAPRPPVPGAAAAERGACLPGPPAARPRNTIPGSAAVG